MDGQKYLHLALTDKNKENYLAIRKTRICNDTTMRMNISTKNDKDYIFVCIQIECFLMFVG